jgi:hypothetical protein
MGEISTNPAPRRLRPLVRVRVVPWRRPDAGAAAVKLLGGGGAALLVFAGAIPQTSQ